MSEINAHDGESLSDAERSLVRAFDDLLRIQVDGRAQDFAEGVESATHRAAGILRALASVRESDHGRDRCVDELRWAARVITGDVA